MSPEFTPHPQIVPTENRTVKSSSSIKLSDSSMKKSADAEKMFAKAMARAAELDDTMTGYISFNQNAMAAAALLATAVVRGAEVA